VVELASASAKPAATHLESAKGKLSGMEKAESSGMEKESAMLRAPMATDWEADRHLMGAPAKN
jgi:hypothetical protein